MDISPVTLVGNLVRLEPLQRGHTPALIKAGMYPELWRWTHIAVHTPAEMEQYVEAALAGQAAGTMLPFVLIAQQTGEIVGSTRYGNIERAHRNVEIGWTWLTPAWQRTGLNVEAKYLMLRHAFETLGCLRVGIKTGHRNLVSQNAIRALGAKEEGTLRNHMILPDGSLRHTVYFSIIDEEWPAVQAHLEARLHHRASTSPAGLP